MNKNLVFCTVVFFFSTVNLLSFADSESTLIGDTGDGSRAIPVHRIPLLDEAGQAISPTDDPLLPFSLRQTCAFECHRYETISTGWHFNEFDPKTPSGRPGHPWIWVDPSTGVQMPLSYRSWQGVIHPDTVGISPWQLTLRFGRHLPGGGVGEATPSTDFVMRSMVSGKLEINCLACHDGDPAHDQAEYAVQISRQNFRWAAAATGAFASVSGSAKDMPDTYDFQMPEAPADAKLIPPSITYQPNLFDAKKRVFFHILRRIPVERCYFCHSTVNIAENRLGKLTVADDVHLAAGMTCVDCHRNGLDHQILRGYPGETGGSAAAYSCEGCHLGTGAAGKYSAPLPKHRGIPVIHFKKLTCTACHSGSWPESKAGRVKTSLAHGLGIRNVNKSEEALPHIQSPIFAENGEGKIGAYNMIWPAYWGRIKDNQVVPIPPDAVKETLAQTMGAPYPVNATDWLPLNDELLAKTLAALNTQKSSDGKTVYLAGGLIYQLDDQGKLNHAEHTGAQPYFWPLAHDVRPARYSLGVHGCEDCHSNRSPFFFGETTVDSPLRSAAVAGKPMIAYQNLSVTYIQNLNRSFWFRPWFKLITLTTAGLLLFIIFIYGSKAMQRLIDLLSETRE